MPISTLCSVSMSWSIIICHLWIFKIKQWIWISEYCIHGHPSYKPIKDFYWSDNHKFTANYFIKGLKIIKKLQIIIKFLAWILAISDTLDTFSSWRLIWCTIDPRLVVSTKYRQYVLSPSNGCGIHFIMSNKIKIQSIVFRKQKHQQYLHNKLSWMVGENQVFYF